MLRNVAFLILLLIGVQAQAQTLSFTTHLSPENEVQANPVVSDASGIGHFQVNPVTLEFKGFMNVRDLSAAVVGYHIHRGAVGTSGPVIVDLINSAFYTTSVTTKNGVTRITFSGVIQDRVVGGVTVTAQEIMAEILSGNTYFNVHTLNWPAGEVRGQLSLSTAP